jgi:cell division protein FtsB
MIISFRFLIGCLLTAEVAFLGYIYFLGPTNYKIFQHQHAYHHHLQQEIDRLAKELNQLKKELHALTTEPFFKEKIAREELQMGRSDETIYFYSA